MQTTSDVNKINKSVPCDLNFSFIELLERALKNTASNRDKKCC